MLNHYEELGGNSIRAHSEWTHYFYKTVQPQHPQARLRTSKTQNIEISWGEVMDIPALLCLESLGRGEDNSSLLFIKEMVPEEPLHPDLGPSQRIHG